MYKRILFFQAGSVIGPEYIKLIKSIPGVEFVVAVDKDPLAPGLFVADYGEVAPGVNDEGFAERIQQIVDKYKIDYFFPFVELGHHELLKVNANFGCDLEAGELCKDKYLFYKKCEEVGLPVPKSYLLKDYTNQLGFPVYGKPRKGDGGMKNYKIDNERELEGVRHLFAKDDSEFIIQEYLTGHHWAADVVVEDGEVVFVATRRTLGRVYRVEVLENAALVEFCHEVQKKLGIKKIFNLEVFETSEGKFVINEINARMGGNCIASCLAGCDIVSYLITQDRTHLKTPEHKAYSYCYSRVEIDTPNK